MIIKLSRLLALAGALLLLAAACAPSPQLRNNNLLQDTSFITDEPCGPPCWRGIVAGETSWSDALTIIEDDPTLTKLTTRTSENSSIIGAVWAQTNGENCCQMYSEDGQVVDVLILQTTPVTTLGQAVEALGEPAYAIGESLSGEQGVFSLFYPDVSMMLYVFVEGENGALSETSEVIGFGYFAPDRMDLMLLTNELHAWEGYQTYRAYMDSAFEVTPSVTLTPAPEN